MVLALARPSEAWCFPPGADFFKAVLVLAAAPADARGSALGNPPTPADARGSAPGNNTFDPCFGLLPPPLPWCFPIRQLSFEQKEQQQQQQQQQQPAAAGLDGVIRQLSFEQKEQQQQQQQQQQQPAAAGLDGVFPSGNCFLDCAPVEKYCFSRISDDTLGSFLARFWH